MNKVFKLILFTLFWAIGYHNVCAQEKAADSTQQRLVAANMEDAFNKAIGVQSHLYRGQSYELYQGVSRGNAYFNDTTALVNGVVEYNGVSYKNVPLIYDQYRDLLVSRLLNNAFLFSFISEDVQSFDLFDHHFIRVQPQNAAKIVPVGFYDELYKNKLQVLAKRTKITAKGTRGYGVAIIIYSKETNYFLKKSGIYYDVNSRGKFYDVLKDKKKELKKYLKDNNISYGDDPEHAMAILANYYDTLTN